MHYHHISLLLFVIVEKNSFIIIVIILFPFVALSKSEDKSAAEQDWVPLNQYSEGYTVKLCEGKYVPPSLSETEASVSDKDGGTYLPSQSFTV